MESIPLIQRIETERLFIRPFIRNDRDGFIYFMTNEDATRYLLFAEEHTTESGAGKLFDLVMTSYGSTTTLHSYAIARKDNNIIMGTCGISPLSDKQIWECYYGIIPEFWRKGLATEALQALIYYCFNYTMIHELRAYMNPLNPGSDGVALRAGMTDQGLVEHPIVGYRGKMFSITKVIQ